jgi:hypothetical protein
MRDVVSRAETTFLAELASYGSPAGADDDLPPYQGPSHTFRLQYESQQSLQCQDSTHQHPYQQQDSPRQTLSQQDKREQNLYQGKADGVSSGATNAYG